MKIRDLEIIDLRFPTSLTADGTDAVHKDPDYSAAYVILHTDGDLEGHGFTFTIGRGNEVCAEAIRAFAPLVVGRDVDEISAEPAAFWRDARRRLAAALARAREGRDPHLDGGHRQRDVGSAGQAGGQAGVEAARRHDAARDRPPASISSYITDALTPDEAIEILERQDATKAEREARSCCATVIPPTRRPPDGWATRTTRSAGCAAKRSPKASRTSR